MILYIMIFSPIIIGILTYLFTKKYHNKIIILFQACLLINSFFIFHTVKQYGVLTIPLGGLDEGIAITLLADELSSVMLIMLTSIYFALILFGHTKSYFNPQFCFLILTLEGLLMGLFLSTDLFNLFVFLEVSTVVVSILIMFQKEKQAIYDAIIYLLVNVVGATFFLFGIGILYKTFGLLDFRFIRTYMATLENKNAMFLPFSLMMTTLSLKTALMPLFSWLPKAHGTPSAPCIVSAILSGLYVKCGLYLFLRIQEMFSPTIQVTHLFFIVGFLTAIVGAFFAIIQNDIKLILAYSTVSQIGVIMMGIHIGVPSAYWGSIYHIFCHALFKSTLFLSAGLIIEEYGTRDITKIKGVLKRMPVVSFSVIFAILGITGAPFFNGSISKYLISDGSNALLVQIALAITNFGTLLCFLRFSSILTGKSKTSKASIDAYGSAVLIIMGIFCLLSGLLGQQIIKYLFGYNAAIDLFSYLEKALTYVMLLFASGIFYRFVIKNNKMYQKFNGIELNFNGICTAITIYFISFLVYLKFIY